MLFASAALMNAQTPDEVVAQVNGSKITRSDLEKAQGNKLLQIRYQNYVAEQKALEQLIDNRLLEAEATSQKITVDQLIAREVTAKVVDPTDDQIHIYYDDLNIKEPFQEVRAKIIEHVRQSRSARLRANYIDELRTKGNVLVTLAPPEVDVAVGDAPRLGPAEAPVKVIEFADYECPYCAKVHPFVLKLHEEFPNEVGIYYKDMPLPMHSRAQKAAEAARCAREENKFWEYHDKLFSERKLEPEQLRQFARDLKMDESKFEKCLDTGAQAGAVKKDLTEGQQLGLTGTPSFFINGRFVSGAVDYPTLRDIVRQQVTLAKSGPATAAAGK
jgi:protein-disulfide isomerase